MRNLGESGAAGEENFSARAPVYGLFGDAGFNGGLADFIDSTAKRACTPRVTPVVVYEVDEGRTRTVICAESVSGCDVAVVVPE